MDIDLFELSNLRKEWEALFDAVLSYIEENGRQVTVTQPILEYVKTSKVVWENMKLHSMRVISGLLVDRHIVLEFMKEDGKLRDVLICRAFEAKAFGEIRYTRNTFKNIAFAIKLTNKNEKTMVKSEKFKKGAPVSAYKLNGEKFLAVYEYAYDDGKDCCVSNQQGKHCVKLSSTKPANDEESKIIQETIIKPRKEAEKAKKEAKKETPVEEDEVITESEMEEATVEVTE